ncbi:MAG TPA: hypothetical protein DCP36_12110 [Sporomusaceae bacterium]|uniref:hypothetical protein n=1 Tax=Anaerospora sp. TaxID=1960278 RepID=UPI000EC8B2DD|nr:hypothetical protein [Anaerospora sp.]HAK74124.1 hypothetical protein [Sporomusaceae bacterium]
MVEHTSADKAGSREEMFDLAINSLNCGKLTKLIMSRHSIISEDIRYVAFNWADINIFLKLGER